MPTYHDPITMEDLTIDESTVVYLVRVGQAFSLKAISCRIEQLDKDPTSNAKRYWLIDAMPKARASDPIIFPKDELTTETFSPEQVTELFGMTPTDENATLFNPEVTRILNNTGSNNIPPAPPQVSQNLHMPLPHLFFNPAVFNRADIEELIGDIIHRSAPITDNPDESASEPFNDIRPPKLRRV